MFTFGFTTGSGGAGKTYIMAETIAVNVNMLAVSVTVEAIDSAALVEAIGADVIVTDCSVGADVNNINVETDSDG